MPTILRLGSLSVRIYTNDHRPAHVHVGNGNVAVFNMNCPDGTPTVRENIGFSRKELNDIGRSLHDEREHICREWKRLHGDF
ncbi:DUF4160 domain-containing protein [Mycoplana dimorpha]|uniref:Uncharacterized protein DUF4160 n=1 Tax=Mycoplana dimorpha TaxID=28320 RepID=A0A2T5ANQ3_MYCDI|nr:DUF4160 domain-containing protein [Mycoplana dimorpha]PTM88374.1 uncharacterized protein DUF4160 [Mycoplana dimorpha]